MGNRTAKFISALVGGIIAGAPLAAVSQNAPNPPAAASTANAAGDCLASPKGAAPQGQHWFYRVERATKRQCWYLRAEGGKAAQSAQAAADTPNAAPAAPQSVQNAHAEYVAQQGSPAPSAQPQPAPSAAPPPATAATASQQAAVTARWPDAAPAAAAAVSQAAPAQAVSSNAPPAAEPAASPAPAASVVADIPADKPTGSLQKLLLVVGGALALAGILASVIYRFAGSRVRVQTSERRVNWDNSPTQDHDDKRAPWRNAAPAPRAERPRPVDFDAVRPQASQLATFTDEIRRIAKEAPAARVEAAEPDETQIEMFDRKFEIETAAPQLAADDSHDEAPADGDETAGEEDAVNVDLITAMLERLAKEGPRLPETAISEAGSAAPARNLQDRPGVRV